MELNVKVDANTTEQVVAVKAEGSPEELLFMISMAIVSVHDKCHIPYSAIGEGLNLAVKRFADAGDKKVLEL